ncbi:MAG: glycogen/starch synthase [Deltaproteobacteria bacterium]|nr:glycogen/starch synthase [Deltaproteobacteria bacterium]
MPLKLFVVSSQLTPHGTRLPLGETLGELIAPLGERDVQIEVVLPLHSDIDPDKYGLARRLTKLEIDVAGERADCTLYEGRWGPRQARLWFIGHPESFDRETPHARHEDDPARFYLLAKAALQLAQQSESAPNVLLASGWQTGFVPIFARKEAFFSASKIVFSLDDPQELGLFDAAALDQLHIGYDHFSPEGIEFHGQASLLKAGVLFADKVILPSVSAVEDLQQERHGAGLHGLYAAHAKKLVGILGGMDSKQWDPARDHRLTAFYSAEDLSGKDTCKAALQRELDLQRRPTTALLALLGPFSETSQLEHLAAVEKEWLNRKLQLAFIGEAGPEQAAIIERLKNARPDAIAHVNATASEELLHRVLAGADGLLIPDRSQATGLDLLKALRYGAIPVGHAAGAAHDVMVDFDVVSRTGNAFTADDTPASLLAAVDRFLATYESKERWRALQRSILGSPFSWEMTAERWGSVLDSLVTK